MLILDKTRINILIDVHFLEKLFDFLREMVFSFLLVPFPFVQFFLLPTKTDKPLQNRGNNLLTSFQNLGPPNRLYFLHLCCCRRYDNRGVPNRRRYQLGWELCAPFSMIVPDKNQGQSNAACRPPNLTFGYLTCR